jgi:hypothetical protein
MRKSLIACTRFFYLTSLHVCLITASQAALPVWTFEPLTPTAITLMPGEEVTVVYQVTNQSYKTHRLVLTPHQGITQVIAPGTCANPFILDYQHACLLTLRISGDALLENIVGGPIVCQDGNPSQCYRPSNTDQLNVQRTNVLPPPSQASIAVTPPALQLYSNGLAVTLSVQNTSTDTAAMAVTASFNSTALQGLVTVDDSACNTISPGSQCLLSLSVPANTPSIPLTPFIVQGRNTQATTANLAISRPFAYVFQTTSDTVKQCQLDVDGSLSTCKDAGAGFDNLVAMVVNQANTYAYITTGDNKVHFCGIEPQTGSLTKCSTKALDAQLNAPYGITLNERLNKAYISDYGSNAITTCTINQQDASLSNCTNNTKLNLVLPTGITYNTANQQLYIVNPQNGSAASPILNCSLDGSGNITTCRSTSTGAQTDIRFNNNNTYAYIGSVSPNYRTQVCSVQADGTLSNCQDTATDANSNYLTYVYTIALNAANTKAYLALAQNSNDNICDVEPMTGALDNCVQVSQSVTGDNNYLVLAH